MRYSLLNLLACQHCHGELTALVQEEAASAMPAGLLADARRTNPAGVVVGPVPAWTAEGPLTALLRRHTAPSAPPERALATVVKEGLLACGACGRWYPVTNFLPELLPDHLRDASRDAARLASVADHLPSDLADRLRTFRPETTRVDDQGAGHKQAEIGIKDKVDDPAFFGPGHSSPFNPWNPDFTVYLIRVFANVLPLLELKRGQVILDSGCGYAWTTEWLLKSGVEAVGVDICRTYLEIGLQRMGDFRPHLVIADVENLPVRDAAVDRVLAYESFHHIPDRRRAMQGYARVLKEDGLVVLAEPGGDHEHAAVSVDAMEKYGILERGMEIADVAAYVDGTPLGSLEQLYVARVARNELNTRLDPAFLKTHAVVEGNLFRLRRNGHPLDRALRALRAPRRRIWPGLRRRLRAGLIRLGLG